MRRVLPLVTSGTLNIVLLFIFGTSAQAITAKANLDLSCTKCKFGGTIFSEVPIETSSSCAPERNYLTKQLRALKAQDQQHQYFKSRTSAELAEAQLPKKCVAFAMSHFVKNIFRGDEKPVPNFARCTKPTGVPVQNNWAPCMTDDYVNVIYHSFVDVAACLDLPQKAIVPKLINESGFHINSFAPLKLISKNGASTKLASYPFPDLSPGEVVVGGDAGIGQLTGPALSEVKRNINIWSNYIQNSSKPSCRRIVNFMKNLPTQETVNPDINERCSVIYAPPNPMLSMIYYGVTFKALQNSIQTLWQKRGAEELLARNELKLSPKQVATMQEILILLGYNAGPRTAYMLFENWLLYRISNNTKISREEVDFSVGLPKDSVQMVKADGTSREYKLIDLPQKKASHLIAYQQKLLAKMTHQELTPTEEMHLRGLVQLKISRLNFPTYVRIFREGMAKGYLTSIAQYAAVFNKNLGNNICTEESFLAL